MGTKPVRISIETIDLVENFKKQIEKRKDISESIANLANMDNSSVIDFLVKSKLKELIRESK